MSLINDEELCELVCVIDQGDEKAFDGRFVPVELGSIAQRSEALRCSDLVDPFDSSEARNIVASISVEPVGHDSCDVGKVQSLVGQPDEHRVFFRAPSGPGYVVSRHA